MPAPLTLRQKQIHEFLLKSIREKGFAPSMHEIGQRFKIASTNGVSDHLKALEKKGYIRRVGRRAIEVLNALGRPMLSEVREIPILGRVPAGRPLMVEENIEGFLAMGGDIARGNVFALKVKGDSMIEAGILDGDYVIVRSQESAEEGAIVCAMVNGEATVKRFHKKGKSVVLKPENRRYPPIEVSKGELRIVGRIVGLMRKF
jgi:repressor LexA